ncbi:hypothetical protein C1I98_38045, partial [Spongiactinospora gelatinilytica]
MSGVSEHSGAEWPEIVSAALVGTDRRPPYDPADGGDPAVELLERAAVETVRRRAGQRLSRGEPLPPAAAEDRPAVSRAAADRLARILGGEHARLLPEWLAEAARRGLRVPPHLLPELLDHAAKDRSIRPHVAALAGRRGRWLATLHDAWPFLAKELTTPPPAPADRVAPGSATPGRADHAGPGVVAVPESAAPAGGGLPDSAGSREPDAGTPGPPDPVGPGTAVVPDAANPGVPDSRVPGWNGPTGPDRAVGPDSAGPGVRKRGDLVGPSTPG